MLNVLPGDVLKWWQVCYHTVALPPEFQLDWWAFVWFLSFGRNIMTPSSGFSRAFRFRAHFQGILNCTCTGRLIWKLLCSNRPGANLGVQIWARSFQWFWKRKVPPSLTCMLICIWTHFKFLTVLWIRENLLRSDESFQNPVSHCSMSDVLRLCFLKPWLVFCKLPITEAEKK